MKNLRDFVRNSLLVIALGITAISCNQEKTYNIGHEKVNFYKNKENGLDCLRVNWDDGETRIYTLKDGKVVQETNPKNMGYQTIKEYLKNQKVGSGSQDLVNSYLEEIRHQRRR